MPLLSWPAFHEAHGHPYILFVDLLEARRRQSRFALLGSLAGALNLKGAYALLPEKETIRIVFEREADAAALAQALLARRTAREGGWAGQWAVVFDDDMEAKIRNVLPAPKRRAG